MKMKKAICVLLAAAMLGMTGCSTIPQPTMEELMAEVNAEHQAIEKPEVAVEPYSQYVAPRGSVEQDLTPAEPNPDGSLSMEQAQFDINSLFDMVRKNYGLYNFYGGAEVFEAVRQQALADCENAQKMDADVLQQIILDNLSFITDQHFLVGGEHPSSSIYPCFFTEVAFQKTEDSYSTANEKLVESVDGQDNLDELFKRSLTREGEIVYWPITFAESEDAKNDPPSLTVHYTDGSKQTLTAMAYESPEADPEREYQAAQEKNRQLQEQVRQVEEKSKLYDEAAASIGSAILQAQQTAQSIVDEAGGQAKEIVDRANTQAQAITNDAQRFIDRVLQKMDDMQQEFLTLRGRMDESINQLNNRFAQLDEDIVHARELVTNIRERLTRQEEEQDLPGKPLVQPPEQRSGLDMTR